MISDIHKKSSHNTWSGQEVCILMEYRYKNLVLIQLILFFFFIIYFTTQTSVYLNVPKLVRNYMYGFKFNNETGKRH